jgi:hypothetical protein
LFDTFSKECESANVKVRASSLALIGEMYKQLGPALKALVLSNTISDSVKTHLESIFSSTSFDPKANSVPRSKRCVVLASKGAVDDKTSNQALGIEVPRTDLVATLSNDCISRLVSLVFKCITFALTESILIISFRRPVI